MQRGRFHLGQRPVKYWQLVKQAFSDWMEDRAMRLAASLAFYTMLSLAPLLVLAIKAVGAIFGQDIAKRQVTNYFTQLMGAKAAGAIQGMLSYQLQGGFVAITVSGIVLVFSAGAVFGELQDALNTVWEVKPKPNRSWLDIIRERFVPYVLVLGTCFLLLVSLILSTIIASIIGNGRHQGIAWAVFGFMVSLIVITVLFALIFRYLPDVKIRWADVWVGAVSTGVLFTIGKIVLGWYLARGSTTSVYGTAGSLIAVLLWVYYSAQILFFGAELTQAYARQTHTRIRPAANAVRVTEEERTQQGMPSKEHVESAVEQSRKPAPDEHSRNPRQPGSIVR